MSTENVLNKTRNIVMAILFLAMGVVMIFAEQLHLDDNIQFDASIRYMFGGICLIYGAFRIFRIISDRFF